MVSYAHPEQTELAYEVCQSVAHDNGAYPNWTAGKATTNWNPYYGWIGDWMQHPGFEFALIPDVIDGNELDNDALIDEWPHGKIVGVPVWHLHESLDRLIRLCSIWPKVAFGSSGDYATVGTSKWWNRMGEAMDLVCPSGFPMCKLHGLRMLNPEVFNKLPFASADSTNIARNIGIDQKWKGTYLPPNKAVRGLVMAARIESVNSAPYWERTKRFAEAIAQAEALCS